MNIKIELFKACIFMLIGAFLCAHFMPNSTPPPPQVAQEQKSECKIRVVKETKPDGSIKESFDVVADQNQKQEIKLPTNSKPSYGIAAYSDKSIGAELRLGSLPLFLVVESNFSSQNKVGIKLEF